LSIGQPELLQTVRGDPEEAGKPPICGDFIR
jgi:hypothetical protein